MTRVLVAGRGGASPLGRRREGALPTLAVPHRGNSVAWHDFTVTEHPRYRPVVGSR